MLSAISFSSYLSWDCTNLSLVCSCALLCVLNMFCYPYAALTCVFYIVTLLAGVHRNNTEGAAYSNPPKNVLRTNLEQTLISSGHSSPALNQYYWSKSTEVELRLSLCKWTRCVAAQEGFCVVFGLWYRSCQPSCGALSSFVKGRSSEHMSVLDCWYFLAQNELSKL